MAEPGVVQHGENGLKTKGRALPVSKHVPKVEQTLFSGTQVVREVSASITHRLGKTLTPEAFQNTQVSLSGISRAAPPALAGTE